MGNHLSSAQFTAFHGSSRDFKSVRPATEHRKGSIWGDTGEVYGQRAEQHAYATTDEHVAWRFAGNAAGHGGRARVYTVTADADKVSPGRFNDEHPANKDLDPDGWGRPEHLAEYLAPRWKVTGRIDIMPGHQGTFPEIDWNQYGKQRPFWADANHPNPEDDEEIQHNATARKIADAHGYTASAQYERDEWEKKQGLYKEPQRPQVLGQLQFSGRGFK